MEKISCCVVIVYFLTATAFSQTKFSDETKKYIEYNDSVIVFKNVLLINGKGNAAKPHQTVVVSNGKINWVGDDAKAIAPKGATTIDLNGKTLMPGLVMLHEHMYISAHNFVQRYLFESVC